MTKIIISDRTLNILKIFSGINSSIILKPGKIIQTLSEDKGLYAEAEISEDFPIEIGISRLKDFIKILTIQKTVPYVEFMEDHLVISHGQSKLNYVFDNPSYITSAPKGRPKGTDELASFTLEWNDLKEAMATASAMGFETIALKADHGNVCFTAYKQNNNYIKTIDKVTVNKDLYLLLVLNFHHLKKLEHDDYTVTLFKERRVKFVSGTDVEYHLIATKESELERK